MTEEYKKMLRTEAKLMVNKSVKGNKQMKRLATDVLFQRFLSTSNKLENFDAEMKAIKSGVTSKAVLAREVDYTEWQYSKVRQTVNLVKMVKQKMSELLPIKNELYYRYQFLLKYGMYWSSGQKSNCIAIMQPRECFKNSFQLCKVNADFAYVDGFQRTTYDGDDSLIPHAWCTDVDGDIADATFQVPNGCEYLGVPFDIDYVQRIFCKTGGRASVISNHNDNVDIINIIPEEIIDARFVNKLCGKEEVVLNLANEQNRGVVAI